MCSGILTIDDITSRNTPAIVDFLKEKQITAAPVGKDNHHIILLHAHNETEEMVPEYYKLFLQHALENGLTFEKPEFIKL